MPHESLNFADQFRNLVAWAWPVVAGHGGIPATTRAIRAARENKRDHSCPRSDAMLIPKTKTRSAILRGPAYETVSLALAPRSFGDKVKPSTDSVEALTVIRGATLE